LGAEQGRQHRERSVR